MVSKCYFCKGKVYRAPTTLDFRWGDRLFVIEGVPTSVCHQCGEKYLESHVYKTLERLANCETRPLASLTVDVLAYEPAECIV